MIEILNIFSFSIFFSLLLFIPFVKKINFLNKIEIIHHDLRTLNILFLCNLILILLLIGFKLSFIIYIFYSLLFIQIFYFIINFKKFNLPKNIYYYFFFFFLILFILSVDLSKNLSLYWDSQKIWFPKAIILYFNGSVSDLQNTSYSHYSFLGSLLWAFFWKISSFGQEYFGRMFFLAIFCTALINFLNLVKVNKHIKIISFLLLILLIYDYWHLRGTQEILIFSFLLLLSKYLYDLINKTGDFRINFICILLSLNLIIWTKNEGILISLIINFILLIFLKENIKFKLILLSITLSLIFLRFFIFKLYGLDLNLSKDFDFSNVLNIFIYNFNTANLFIILKYIIFSCFKFPHIILSLLFALLIVFDKKIFKKIIFLYVYLFLSIFLIFFIYLCSDQNMDFMISTGSFRLMFEFSAPYLLFVLVFFKEKYKI